MREVLLRLLEMSLEASVVIGVVFFLRAVFFRRGPGIYAYLLWMIVLVRLICPVTLPMPAGVPSLSAEVSQALGQSLGGLLGSIQGVEMDGGVVWIGEPFGDGESDGKGAADAVLANGAGQRDGAGRMDGVKETGKPRTQDFTEDDQRNGGTGGAGANIRGAEAAGQMAAWRFLLAAVWLSGAGILWVYELFRYRKLSKTLSTAWRLAGEERTYLSDQITEAFTAGIFRPRIYLPADLDEGIRACALAHEKLHVKRHDNLAKGLWFAAASFHWFNPLVWVAYAFMCRDMELSCDEAVVRNRSLAEKKEYARALLYFAEQRQNNHPALAFGESNTKMRIKRVLASKPCTRLQKGLLAVILLGAILCLLTGGAGGMAGTSDKETVVIGGASGPTSIFIAGKRTGESMPMDPEELSRYAVSPGEAWGGDFGEKDSDENELTIDLAREDALIFHHPSAGYFVFWKRNGSWNGERLEEQAQMEELRKILELEPYPEEPRITREDRFLGSETYSGAMPQTFDAVKWKDGRIALLLGYTDNLADVCYCYYDPAEDELCQVYLFDGVCREIRQKGLREMRYLGRAEGWNYYLESPKEITHRAGQNQPDSWSWRSLLTRKRQGQEEILSTQVVRGENTHDFFLFLENRILYLEGEEDSAASFESPSLVSLSFDLNGERASVISEGNPDSGKTLQIQDRAFFRPEEGRIRRIAMEGDQLFIETAGDERSFPHTLYRVNADLTERKRLGTIDGSFLALWQDKVIYLGTDGRVAVARAEAGIITPERYLEMETQPRAGRYRVCDARLEKDVLIMELADRDRYGEGTTYIKETFTVPLL